MLYYSVSLTFVALAMLSILIIGAYTVMNDTSFTIGMLVTFQMFASRLSQPLQEQSGSEQSGNSRGQF